MKLNFIKPFLILLQTMMFGEGGGHKMRYSVLFRAKGSNTIKKNVLRMKA